MRPSTTARRYAEAAYTVAKTDGDTQTWLTDLGTVASTVRRPDVASFFKDPKASRQQKQSIVEQAFGSLRPHALNLVRLLVSQDRVYLLPAVYREFLQIDREARDITEARVTVARQVTDDELSAIADRLRVMTGKTVEIQVEVDPSILGGIVVRIGDELIDASVVGRLNRLRHELAI